MIEGFKDYNRTKSQKENGLDYNFGLRYLSSMFNPFEPGKNYNYDCYAIHAISQKPIYIDSIRC
jgi:hypothetical protein